MQLIIIEQNCLKITLHYNITTETKMLKGLCIWLNWHLDWTMFNQGEELEMHSHVQ